MTTTTFPGVIRLTLPPNRFSSVLCGSCSLVKRMTYAALIPAVATPRTHWLPVLTMLPLGITQTSVGLKETATSIPSARGKDVRL